MLKRRAPFVAFARDGAVAQGAAEQVDDVIRDGAAVVVAFIDNGGLLVGLREIKPIEINVAAIGRVRHVNVGQFPAAQFVHFAAVVLFPGAVAQIAFIVDGNNGYLAGIFSVSVRSNFDANLFACRVFKKAEDLRGGVNIRAIDFEQIVSRFDVHSRLRQRGAQIRIPIFSVEDAREAKASIFNFVIRAKQADLHLGRFRHISAKYKHVADGYFAEHFRKEMIQIGATAGGFYIRRVFLFGCGNIQTMKVRVVQEVAFDAPHFVVHLCPLRARVGVNLHVVEFQRPLAGLRRRSCCCNEPRRWPHAIKNLFPIRGKGIAADSAHKWFGLACGQVELAHGQLREWRAVQWLNQRRLRNIKRSRFARIERSVVRSFNGQRNNALPNSVKVDGDGYGLFLFVILLFLFFVVFLLFFLVEISALAFVFVLALVLILVGVLRLVFRLCDFFVVALRLYWIGIALLEHHGIDAARDRPLESGKIEPRSRQSKIGTCGKEKILAAFVEDWKFRIAQSIGELRALARFERINKDRPLVVR